MILGKWVLCLLIFFINVQCMKWLYVRVLNVQIIGSSVRSSVHIVLYIAMWTWIVYQAMTQPGQVVAMMITVFLGLFCIKIVDSLLGVKQELSLVATVARAYFFIIMGWVVAMSYINLSRLLS